MREEGIVKWFNEKKDLGFITRERAADLLFYGPAVVAEADRPLREGDRVAFFVSEGPRGSQAVSIVKIA